MWHVRYDVLFDNKTWFRRLVESPDNSAWSTSYLLRSLWVMYEHSGDRKYLDELVYQSDVLIKKSTDYGWPTANNSNNGESITWLVHSASVLYPVLLAAREMRNSQFADSVFDGKSYLELSNEWTAFAKLSLATFDSQRITHKETFGKYKGTNTLYYKFPAKYSPNTSLANTLYPYNMQNTAGKCFLVIHDITGEQQYRNLAEGLAKFFFNRLGTFTYKKETGYVWGYRPVLTKAYPDGTKAEDIGHGDHGCDFAIEAAKRNIVFTASDSRRFACTLWRLVDTAVINRRNPTERVDNSTSSYGTWIDLYDWLPLSEYRTGIFEPMEAKAAETLLSGSTNPFAQYPLTLAQLARLLQP